MTALMWDSLTVFQRCGPRLGALSIVPDFHTPPLSVFLALQMTWKGLMKHSYSLLLLGPSPPWVET